MQSNFRLGCAVWAFKDWVGEFYPPKSQATHFLRLYGERMTTVEGNTTFYSIPSADLVQRWRQQVPGSFRFCPKLPQGVTHQGALMPQQPAALDFLKLMQALGDRLGPIMVQLPPSYSPLQFQDLADFLAAWPRQTAPIALEVRHLDWFQDRWPDQLNGLLQDLGVGRILLDSRPVYAWEAEGEADPQRHSHRRKPKVPLQPVATSEVIVVRYISHPQRLRNQDYLTDWVSRVHAWLAQGKQVYFFVHCPLEVHSPAIARYFQSLLETNQVPVLPLPWNLLAQPPSQLALF